MLKTCNPAVIYIHNDEFSKPIPEKLKELENFAGTNNLTIIKKYVDKNSYCNPYERSSVKRLLKDAVHGKFRTVLIYESRDISGCDAKTGSFLFDLLMAGTEIKFLNEYYPTMEAMKFYKQTIKNIPQEQLLPMKMQRKGKAVQLKLKK